ncbi:MAG: sugar transferase [SAR202 cluster bacterium]|nr:sugar transferase [SAR202 cluster bacterium]
MQRFFDVFFSVFAIVFLCPILILIICILKLTGEGEVFYIQERVGQDGKVFGMLKFATMIKNSLNIGAGEITICDDPRVLPFGKFLRKSKINELPQLWNIVIGDMSIVGPRPMIPNTFANYSKRAQDRLNTVRPGLTGIGSIIFRDEERYLSGQKEPKEFYKKNISPYKSEIEIWFVENNSLQLYFMLIVATVWIVMFPQSKIVDTAFKGLPSKPESLR